MKAIGYLDSLNIDQQNSLIDIDIPVPTPAARDLLVKIEAISVNPVDTKIRANVAASGDEHKVLGWDAVGEVIETGEQTQFYKKGDKVWYAGDLTRPGTNAEYHLVDERIVGHKPASVSDAEAAALPLTAITAWELLFDRLALQPLTEEKTKTPASTENRILIIGAAGGVGSILVQLAAQLTDALVIGTASRPESQQWVKELGADHVIDHRKPLSQELKRIGIENVTHVASLNATDQHYDEIVESLAPQGKLALIDDPSLPLDILKLKMKSISLHWEFMYTRSMFNTHDIEKQRDLLNNVADLIDAGRLKTTLGEHYGRINAENLKRAHSNLETGKAIGKIVLEVF
ncbi:zinc-binding alcohol dehydrogenase family protein [Amphritea balenae]|uniref:Zinc-type alcohol dehydrogenase-like protein n=1 Tax=Amphritea balenae TaxID=452629 RepID=A0A3P1SX98_9GAMM|nr:zinc-binding alcohol dehydrogenase family protein [Amphritea balenae]RRD01744.1 zinc-binding alcohol dehydrogenase family protein [Amphritea balenae]GGK54427.1 NADPH:quinone reductase [Amphritea balenae]